MQYDMILWAQSDWGWSNVESNSGVAIAFTGMVIVFSALTLITVFIALLPRALEAVEPYLPKVDDPAQAPAPAESTLIDEQSVVVAVGYVLHTEMQKARKG